jgi:hypothetical protein
MWVLNHYRGCGKAAVFRIGKPLPTDPIINTPMRHLDGSQVEFAEPCVCGSCGADLTLVDMAPHNFEPVTDKDYQRMTEQVKGIALGKQHAPGEAPRVTPERIDELLSRVMYRYENPDETTSTFAHAYLDGEFYLVSGFSACVVKENFDADKGRQYALKDAEPKVRAELWKLEGYALRLRLEGEAA